jgi:hypothetical protein
MFPHTGAVSKSCYIESSPEMQHPEAIYSKRDFDDPLPAEPGKTCPKMSDLCRGELSEIAPRLSVRGDTTALADHSAPPLIFHQPNGGTI